MLIVMVNKVVAVHDGSILGSGARREDHIRRWFSTPTDSTG